MARGEGAERAWHRHKHAHQAGRAEGRAAGRAVQVVDEVGHELGQRAVLLQQARDGVLYLLQHLRRHTPALFRLVQAAQGMR